MVDEKEIRWFMRTYGLSRETVIDRLKKGGFICP